MNNMGYTELSNMSWKTSEQQIIDCMALRVAKIECRIEIIEKKIDKTMTLVEASYLKLAKLMEEKFL